jgi:hypothetical protein
MSSCEETTNLINNNVGRSSTKTSFLDVSKIGVLHNRIQERTGSEMHHEFTAPKALIAVIFGVYLLDICVTQIHQSGCAPSWSILALAIDEKTTHEAD